jgi:hypothetical protein
MDDNLTATELIALAMLARAEPRGVPESLLVDAHGFAVDALAGLLRQGFASVAPETMRPPRGRTITVVRMRITDAGQQALATMRKH